MSPLTQQASSDNIVLVRAEPLRWTVATHSECNGTGMGDGGQIRQIFVILCKSDQYSLDLQCHVLQIMHFVKNKVFYNWEVRTTNRFDVKVIFGAKFDMTLGKRCIRSRTPSLGETLSD